MIFSKGIIWVIIIGQKYWNNNDSINFMMNKDLLYHSGYYKIKYEWLLLIELFISKKNHKSEKIELIERISFGGYFEKFRTSI